MDYKAIHFPQIKEKREVCLLRILKEDKESKTSHRTFMRETTVVFFEPIKTTTKYLLISLISLINHESYFQGFTYIKSLSNSKNQVSKSLFGIILKGKLLQNVIYRIVYNRYNWPNFCFCSHVAKFLDKIKNDVIGVCDHFVH
jgi:hypothetical protein